MFSVVRRSLTICLSSLLIGGTATFGAVAAESPSEPKTRARTVEELLETLNNRSPAPIPDVPVDAGIRATEDVPEAVSALEADAQTVRLRLSLSDRRVYVYRGDMLERSYPVAIGRDGWETPTGEFEVFSQIVDPGWMNPITEEVVAPGPNNPLGDRWIAFWTDGLNSIGFHGTPNRESVGQAASHGCIRMYNEDVRQLFEIVAVGTPVLVEP